MTIAIIGAGYTGLTAAYRLSEAGHKVTIFERSNDLGGLAGGFKIQGTNLEKTYHHIFKTDTDIINFVKELGIEDKLTWNDSSLSIYYGEKMYPFMTPLDLLKFKPLGFFNRIRAGLVVLYLQKTKNWKRFTKVSAYAWMKEWSGEQVTKVIWKPLLKGKFDNYYNKVAMAWLWARLHIRANSREKGDAKEKLGYFSGGFNVITEAILDKLKKNKVEIITGVNVEEVRSEKSLPEADEPLAQKVKITYSKVPSSGKESGVSQMEGVKQSQILEFDKLIATTPSHIFAKLIENNKQIDKKYLEKLSSINYLGAVCMIFSSDQDLSKYYWHNINDLSSPFLVFINHTKLIDKKTYGGKNIYYIGSYIPHDHKYFEISDEELSKLWFDYLNKIFPEFKREEIIDKFIFRLKNAQHIVDLDYENKIPEYKTPLKNVYLSNFSQIFPEDRGTNYAVREGNKIAEMILNSK